jgi:pectate lyase
MKLRLDATGSELRGYVDGVLMLEATDTTFATGQSGLATFKAAARFGDYEAYQP